MFKAIEYLACPGEYVIIDGDFELAIVGGETCYHPFTIAAIISLYKNKNLNVVENITAYYRWCQNFFSIREVEHLIIQQAELIDNYIPDLQYVAKYNSCILRQFRQSMWSGK